MKIEWLEKHSIDIPEKTLQDMAKNMDEYAKPYGWNIVEHCLEEWVGEAERQYNPSSYIENWDEIVANLTKIVRGYKDEENNN